jgi:hypothetical protein
MDDDTWGVYVRPNGVSPTSNTITGSGQVTIVMPLGFSYSGLTSVNGFWVDTGGRVDGPTEAPTKSYVSFGLQAAEPSFPIPLAAGTETLLFTIDRDDPCPDSIYLIDCNTASITDPFCPDYPDGTPGENSEDTNPGNDLQTIDFGNGGALYSYVGNYALSAWSCHDCDGDGILNGLEDSNGNGTFDPGIDTSALCDPCDPIHVETATLEFVDGAETICSNDIGDTASFVVHIEGGWSPYTVIYSDGTQTDTVTNYLTGDTINVVVTASTNITLTTVIDSFLCEIDPDSLFGTLPISVHGPISFTDEPDDVVECSDHGTVFCAETQNLGDGTVFYKWQLSTDGGTTFVDLEDGFPYDSTDAHCLHIDEVLGLDSNLYRVKIWTEVCDTVFSDSALLRVDGPITVTDHPDNITNCDSETAFFTAAASNTGNELSMAYQWQYSTNGTTFYDLPNGAGPGSATYAGVTTTTVNLSNIDVSQDGWYFRMKISTGQCDTVYTNAARLDIEGPITITDDPDDFSNCAGNEVFFIANYSNPGASYGSEIINFIWQIADASTGPWTNLDNSSGVYTGISGITNGTSGADTLTITNVVGLNGKYYRIVYTSATCSVQVPSAAALLEVSGNVAFSNHPDDITLCSGGDTIFVAEASIPQGAFTWGWQVSTDNGATWSAITLPSGVYSHTSTGAVASGTDTLRISNVAGLYNYRYRAVAFATDCDSVLSNEARLLVQGPVTVANHPDDVVECSGNPTTFDATATVPAGAVGNLEYQWQLWTPASGDTSLLSSWINLPSNATYVGVSTPTLAVTNVAGMYGYRFRLRIGTANCNDIFTYSALLTVEGPITVTDQPDEVTICSGDPTSFTSTASLGSGNLGSPLAYQWQVSSDNGVNWTNIGAGTDGGVYTNFNTTTLNVSDVAGLYTRCYRMQFTTGECSAVYSQRACLTVEGPITITDQPDNVTQCSGEAVVFNFGYSDSSEGTSTIQFQWQESPDNSTWTNIYNDTLYNGTNADSLALLYTTGKDNYYFRCLVWSGTCDTTITASARLTVEGPLTVTDEPDDVSQCSGEAVTFSSTIVNAGLGTITYQWEESRDNGATWQNLSNAGVYSGVTTNTLSISNVAYKYNYRYRLRYRTPNCDAQWTDYAILTVEGPIEFTSQPRDTVQCSGSPMCFSVTTFDSSTVYGITSTVAYQWQIRLNGSSTWLNLNNNSTYSGTRTNFMCISNVAGLDSANFRVFIRTTNCDTVYSDPALLEVEGPITFSDHPDDITQCSGESVTFTAAASIQAGNSGTISYRWQISDNASCVNYSNLSDGGVPGYVGTTTNSLTITDVAGLSGRCFRLVATTGTCSAVYSFSAKLLVEGPLSIALNPIDITNCADKEAFFFADINNPGYGGEQTIGYQWQVRQGLAGTWANVADGTYGANSNSYAGANGDTLLIAPILGLNNTYYRLMSWTSTCDTVITTAALLNVEGPITFTDHPDDVTLCSNDGTSFTVAINNSTGVGSVQYQWEYSTNGVSWNDVTNVAPYSGATTNTLNISSVAGLYNYKYRCRVRTGDCDWEYSQLAQLFVEGPITISLQPQDFSVCSNVDTIIWTTVTNPGSGALQFQWQLSSNGGATWSNISAGQATGGGGVYTGVKTEDLHISLTNGLNNYRYRLVIRTSTCADTTDVAIMTVRDACLASDCDFDLDGEYNGVDLDDDNDQVTDVWEDWINLHNTLDGWYYLDNTGDTLWMSNCDTDSDDDGIPDNQEDPDGDNINNGEETDGDTIFDGNPLDPCDPVLGPTCIGINIAIKMGLQGSRIGVANPTTDTLQRDDLRKKALIPLEEPYENMNSFSHVGDGQLTDLRFINPNDSADIFGVTGPDAIVDWVFVELRPSTNLDSIATTRAGLVQRDGDVVDLDGVSPLRFPSANAGAFYVSVRHRNHLGVMTAEVIELSPIVQELDFTDPSFITNGTYAQINLNSKTYMWGADLNSDGRSIYQGPGNDVLKLFTTVLYDPGNTQFLANYISQGYHTSDVNLDGRSIYQGPANDRAMVLFNVILSYPANNQLANYVILEQLP